MVVGAQQPRSLQNFLLFDMVEFIFCIHIGDLLNKPKLVGVNKIYQKVAERYQIIPPSRCLELKLIFTRKHHISLKLYFLILLNMLPINFERCSKLKVDNPCGGAVNLIEINMSLPVLAQNWEHVDVSDHNVFQLKVIVSHAY